MAADFAMEEIRTLGALGRKTIPGQPEVVTVGVVDPVKLFTKASMQMRPEPPSPLPGAEPPATFNGPLPDKVLAMSRIAPPLPPGHFSRAVCRAQSAWYVRRQ